MSASEGDEVGGTLGELRAGRLLVSSARLEDPNFRRTVVLLLNADEDGALGVVLNRPGELSVGEVLPDWAGLAEPDVLFQGGPVEVNAALAVGLRRTDAAADQVPHPAPLGGFQVLTGDLGLVDLDRSRADLPVGLTALRIYVGYAGWGAEQLQAELAEGSWHILDPQPGDLFGSDPAGLWSRLLRRQPGDLAMLSTLPVDVSMN